MITSVEIKAAIVAAVISGTLLTTAIVGANIYHAKLERGKMEAPEPEIAVNKGKALFAQSCAPCHGRNADGGEDAPSLQKLDISETHISLLIHSGIKGEMPSFAKKYSNSQIESIVKYLKTLTK
jgi:cytochrome c oxidase cbb3-type subunit 3